MKSLLRTTRTLRIAFLIAGVTGLATAYMSWQTIEREHQIDMEDLTRRSRIVAHRLVPSAAEAINRSDTEMASMLGPQLEGHSRLMGLAVFNKEGQVVAAGGDLVDFADTLKPAAAKALASNSEVVELVRYHEFTLHILAKPVESSQTGKKAVLAAVHDASYLDERGTNRLLHAFFWVFVLTLGLFVGTVLLTWLVYESPLFKLAHWMKGLRMGDGSESSPPRVPVGMLSEESEHLAASFRAARSSSWARSTETVRHDKVWTRERLAAHATNCLAGAPLIVVSNREPYIHMMKDGEPRLIVPASGLVTAVDPVLQACGGLWVAHGAGDADRISCDSRGRLTVPPRDPRYTLKRVWITREDEQGYYYGFSNEGLWPLCHLTHERPIFRSSDWDAYVNVNRQFAQAVLQELGPGNALVWVQDFHLALLPQMIKTARPDVKVGLFWHIPWPHAEAFRICPWGPEIVRGMLGADLIGFHLQQHCNNFLDTVDRVVEARLDWDQFAVDLERRRTLVRPFPISVQNWSDRNVASGDALATRVRELKERHKLEGVQLGVGVERIDYTKGLVERFNAIGRFLEKHPEFRKRFTFVQLGAPSRTHIRRYRDLVTELESAAEAINWRFQEDGWKPIHFLVAHHDPATVHVFLSMASLCIVSSLHDGMNLVAKEYASAQSGGDGTLILSEFAGAARELSDALIINPYDGEAFADAIHMALTMPPEERRQRMARMYQSVEENNVYRWAADFLAEAARSKAPLAQGSEAMPGKQA